MVEHKAYPHEELLASPSWLAEHLNDPNIKLVDSRAARDYTAGHIPGAISLTSPAFKAQGALETCSAEEFADTVGGLGIGPSDTVVCYDDRGPSAARTWWAFTRFGHGDVRFLHGGIRQWQEAGYNLATEPGSHSPVAYELGEGHDELACTLPQAIDSLNDADALFWDTRSAEEYSGVNASNNPADRVGHIPRAVHIEWNELTDPATGFFKPANEMRGILEAKGITPEKQIITY